MIEIVTAPISVEQVISSVKAPPNGCVLAYVGFIRDTSGGKPVHSVTYNADGNSVQRLRDIAREVAGKWPLNGVAIQHRVGELRVGDCNLVVAVAAGHRTEAFAACQEAIDLFKEKLPTSKKEVYRD